MIENNSKHWVLAGFKTLFGFVVIFSSVACSALATAPLAEPSTDLPTNLYSSKVAVWSDACVFKRAPFKALKSIRLDSIEWAANREREISKQLKEYGLEHTVVSPPVICAHPRGPSGYLGAVLERWDGPELHPKGKIYYPFPRTADATRDSVLAESLIQLRCHYLRYAKASEYSLFKGYGENDFHAYGVDDCSVLGVQPLDMPKLRSAFEASDYLFVSWAVKVKDTAMERIADAFFPSAVPDNTGTNIALFDIKKGSFVWGGHPDSSPQICHTAGSNDLAKYLSPLMCKQKPHK